MKIAPVTSSTKRDRSKIDWAGVDTGAKMFVGLRGDRLGSANPATTAPQKGTTLSVRELKDRTTLAISTFRRVLIQFFRADGPRGDLPAAHLDWSNVLADSM